MRTTLTIDPDVAVRLEKLRRDRNLGLKEVINEALRHGLQAIDAPPGPRKPYRMKTYDGGQQLIPFDNVAETIALLEGDDHK